VIEPFDAKRHEALLTTMPIQPLHGLASCHTHRLDVADGRRQALCKSRHAMVCSEDWRLVNCPACRTHGEVAPA
jgi:Zn finger protein HypA/HybF involved in hydrogenase expression